MTIFFLFWKGGRFSKFQNLGVIKRLINSTKIKNRNIFMGKILYNLKRQINRLEKIIKASITGNSQYKVEVVGTWGVVY